MKSFTVDRISLKSLNSLKVLDFKIDNNINIDLQKYVFEIVKLKIENFNFKSLSFNIHSNSLEKSLELYHISNLNFDYFYIICNKIDKLKIWNSNSENISKLLSSHHFPNLLELEIKFSEITRIEKKLFGELPMLQKLIISSNKNLEIIDENAFSILKQLVHLDLSSNRIESLEKMTFFELVNLNYLDLRSNRLKSLDENMFSGLKYLKTLELYGNFELPRFPYDNLLKHLRREYVIDNFLQILIFQFFLIFFYNNILKDQNKIGFNFFSDVLIPTINLFFIVFINIFLYGLF